MRGYRQIYQSAPSLALLDPVCGALNLLADVAPKSGRQRGQIVSLIGQASSLAATMLMLDKGDCKSASRYLAVAARAAQQCSDVEVLSITMAARAFDSTYGGDPTAAWRSPARRRTSRRGAPRTRGWVAAVESEMHATAGDQSAWERSRHRRQPGHGDDAGRPWKGIGAFTRAKLTGYRWAGLVRLHRVCGRSTRAGSRARAVDPVKAKRVTAHIDLADASLVTGSRTRRPRRRCWR